MPTQQSNPTTVRLDAEHEQMLADLQADQPGTSRQKVFEGLIEDAHARRHVSLTAVIARVVERNAIALDKLRDL